MPEIGVALLGAGIFAREEHLPAIEASTNFALKAVFSRSQQSAQTLASQSKIRADVYFDTPSSPDKSLDALLARNDISTVIICLPITTQPAIIKKALRAGKHVLSEKPIAKDVAIGKELMEWHKKLSGGTIWAVGENLRFVEAVAYGAEQVKELGGDVVTFGMEMFTLIGDDDKYFNTDWRKIPDYQGGFLLDGGVHFVAGLRLLLNAARQEVDQLSARTTLLQKKLAPVDTVHAILTTQSGRSGTFSVSFGTEFKSGFQIQVVTTHGSVTVTPVEVTTIRKGADGNKAEEKKEFGFTAGVKPEVEAFQRSIEAGKVDEKQSPEQALKDLEILEGMLKSGEKGGVLKL